MSDNIEETPRRRMSDHHDAVDPVTQLAIQLAVETARGAMREDMRSIMDDFRRDSEGTFRTCATCDARHDGLPKDMATEADVKAVSDKVDAVSGRVDTTNARQQLIIGGLMLVAASIPVALFIAHGIFTGAW